MIKHRYAIIGLNFGCVSFTTESVCCGRERERERDCQWMNISVVNQIGPYIDIDKLNILINSDRLILCYP